MIAGFAAGFAAPPLAAQDSGAAVQPRAPVYSLPPGRQVETDPQQPQVQGPRVPGESAPRLIRPEGEQPERQARDTAPPPIPQVEQAEQPVRSAGAEPRPTPAREPVPQAPTAATAVQAERDPVPAQPPDAMPGGVRPDSSPSAPPVDEIAPASPGDGGFPLPWWLLAAGALLLAIGGVLLWRRRAVAAEGASAEQPVTRTAPVPRPVSAAAPRPPRPSVAPGPPATLSAPVRLHVDFYPSAARLTPIGFTIRYCVRLSNIGVQPASSVAIDMGVRAADSHSHQGAASELETRFEVAALPVGALEEHEGEIRLPTQAFRAFRIDQRMLLFPIVDLVVRHGGPGKETAISASFLIGQERSPPGAKMAPFRLDKGLGQYKAVGGRRIELSAAA